MLADENAAVNRYNIVLGEGFMQLTACLLIVFGLSVGGHQYGAIDDEEVGVSSRKAMAVVGVVDGRREREGEEAVASLGDRIAEHTN